MTINLVLNSELNGVEVYFDSKPIQKIIDTLKENGFRWSGFKKCWWAKQTEKTLNVAKAITGTETFTEEVIKVNAEKKTKTKEVKLSLWDRVQFTEGTVETSKYRYKFVGSNYTGLSTKETASEIRKHLKVRFPEVKFSVTSERSKIDITIKESPYCWKKLEYSYEIEARQYREYEKENSKELIAIKDYCQKLLDSYNFDDSDGMTDYFHCHYYTHVSIDYTYTQTEQNEEIKEDVQNFRNKLKLEEVAEFERKEKEMEDRRKQREQEIEESKKRHEEEKKQIEMINNSVSVVALDDQEQYFVLGSQFAHLNKNNTLEQYVEEVEKGEYSLENVKITKEVHFENLDTLENFSNMLLNDFEWLQGTGGSYTDDVRINSMTDYHNMDKEERESVIWNLYGVAIYYNNELQFVVDAQGYSYARYVGLVANVTITKTNKVIQLVNNEELQELKDKAEALTDYSTSIIINNNIKETWNKEAWTEYKEAIKGELKKHNIKLCKAIIQQINGNLEELKISMYRLLQEVDGIQEQFKNADIQQGQKITMFYISDFGGIVTQKVTMESVENTEYAQYNNTVKVVFTPQGKRSKYYNHFYSTLLVYDGWLELPESVLYDIVDRGNGIISKKTKYTSCDRKQYDEILEHFAEHGIKPIVNTHKPIF